MRLTGIQTLIMIIVIAAGTAITRFSPFLLFPDSKEPPKIIHSLGKLLPSAMMGLLIVYCLKNISIFKSPFGIPEFIAIFIVVILHKWKNNVLLSIGGGTIIYMLFVQIVFQ